MTLKEFQGLTSHLHPDSLIGISYDEGIGEAAIAIREPDSEGGETIIDCGELLVLEDLLGSDLPKHKSRRYLMVIPRDIATEMDRICREADPNVSRESLAFNREHVFDNGLRMAIQVCPTPYPSEPRWSQGVLFDQEGFELAVTEVHDRLTGEFTVEYDEDVYTVEVVAEPETTN
jgi:hypothetical protein